MGLSSESAGIIWDSVFEGKQIISSHRRGRIDYHLNMIDAPKAVVHVRNMQDGDAVREVAEALLGVEGVSDVEMDEEQGVAVVDLVDGVQVTREDLVRAVQDAGFVADQISMPPGR